ncbi:hypothetical protein ACFLRY_00075 [Bacteroidota bacterium]
MKTKTLLTLIIAILFIAPTFSQETFKEQLVVPLSDPGKAGKLEVNLVAGSIEVIAYDGKDVIIDIVAEMKKISQEKKEGMTRISGSSIDFSAEEDNNTVSVETSSWKNPVDIKVKVPKNFDLDISTVNNGHLHVTGVRGNIEASNVNGEIIMEDVGGSVLANTVNGKLVVDMVNVSADVPMSFTNLNGEINVTFPSDLKATCRMKSDMGEIFTDFTMEVEKRKPKVDKKSSKGVYKVEIDEWIMGDINGGGPTYTFKSFNGDIYIKKK